MKQSGSSPTHARPSPYTSFLGVDIEAAAPRVLAAIIIYTAVRNLVAATAKPFWYDEMLTWIVAHQPNVSGIWNALKQAADTQGPAFYVIEKAMIAMIPKEEIALRLPSILGYCCITLCIFVFVRRRAGSACALICALVPLPTVLFHVYAVEARAYSLFVACDAVALVCYQRASSWRWTVPMGCFLALAESLHYYAVLVLVPIGLAEAARFLRAREFRIGVWLALLCGAVPLVAFWPLLWRLREVYGAHYWARPAFASIAAMYGAYFETTGRWGVAAFAALAFGVVRVALPLSTETSQISPEREDVFAEQLLILGLVGLPFVGYVVTKMSQGGFTFRYALPTLLGVPLALGYILPRLKRSSIAAILTFLLFAVGVREGLFWLSYIGHPGSGEAEADSIERLVAAAGHPELPVVVSDGLQFLPLAHYAEPDWQNRFACVVDAKKALAYTRIDGLDVELVILRTLWPIHVYDFPAFASRHPMFLLYSDYSTEDPFDWWPARFVDDGDSVRLVATDHNRKVYLVSLNENPK